MHAIYDSDVGGYVDPLTGELVEVDGPRFGPEGPDLKYRVVTGAVKLYYRHKHHQWVPRTTLQAAAEDLVPEAIANPTGELDRPEGVRATYSLVRLLWDWTMDYEKTDQGRKEWNAWRRSQRRAGTYGEKLKRKLKLPQPPEAIEAAVGRLPFGAQALLKATADLRPQADIARLVGVTARTVKRHKRAAVAALVEVLDQR